MEDVEQLYLQKGMTVRGVGKLYKTNDRPITKLLHQSVNPQVIYKLLHPGLGKIQIRKKKSIIRKCEICNSDDNVCFNKIARKYLCERHRNQICFYGKILLNTFKDKNKIDVFDDYAEIILLNSEYEEIGRALISLDKLDKARQYNWRSQNPLDAKNSYVMGSGNKEKLLLHRYLMDAKDDEYVDHIDRNKLNHLNENLRSVCPSESSVNRGIQSNNTSGVVGVTWDKDRVKWKASLNIYRKCYNLGRFDDFEDAVKARREAEIKYHKEFTPIERQIY